MAKILVIGSGGREHTIVSAFARSSAVSKIYAAPGNTGISLLPCGQSDDLRQYESAKFGGCLPVHSLKDIYDIVLDKHIDLVFVGPEQYLEQGIADYLEDKGVAVVGPGKSAARLESSKIFAKELMYKYGIPTAAFRSFSDVPEALVYAKQTTYPIVIKADGLAAGKGVVIAEDYEQAEKALIEILRDRLFGNAGKNVIIEEYLEGWEASVFAFCDGKDYKLTIASQDHKKLNEHDEGPNTGGMGAYAPVDKASSHLDEIDKKIFKPLFNALKQENIEYKGILYAGLMFTVTGPMVLEFNCRLGDPETQVILPLLKTDFFDLSCAVASQKIASLELEWLDKYAVNVVAASEGYPGSYKKGSLITVNDRVINNPAVNLFYAGVSAIREEAGKPLLLITSGGRVLSVTALGNSLKEAIDTAYANLEMIFFERMYYRKDIGKRGL